VASAPPSASRIFIILAEAEGELSRGLPLRRQRPAPSLSDLGRRAFAACGAWQLLRAWLPGTSGSGAASGVAPDYRSLLRRRLLGGRPTRRTPRGQRSCSGMVPFSFLWQGRERGPTGALSERTLYAGAALVSRWPSVLRWWQPEEVVFADETASAARTPDLRLFGLNGWFSSFVGEGFSAAAFALKPLLQLSCRPRRRSLSLLLGRLPVSCLEFVIPRAPWYGGCSYPREQNRSSV
jgi:hypothetical protein